MAEEKGLNDFRSLDHSRAFNFGCEALQYLKKIFPEGIMSTNSNVNCDDDHSDDELDDTTNSDTEEFLSPKLLQLFNSDTESEDF